MSGTGRGRRGWALTVAGLVLLAVGAVGVVGPWRPGRPPGRVVGPNRPVDAAAAEDQGEPRASNSPSLRRDPRNPAHLAVASRVDSPEPSCALHVSADGGATWTRTPVPLPEVAGVGCFAPDVAFGADGRLYLAFTSLAENELSVPTPSAVWVATSRDHGRSLSAPVRVSGPLAFQVRVVADPRTPGRLHLFWLQATGYTTWGFADVGQPIVSSRSDDAGATWQAPVRVSPPARQRVVAPSPAVGARGELYLAYLDVGDDDLDYQGTHEGQGGAPYAGRWSLVMARSADGGATWSESVVSRRIAAIGRFLVLFPPAPSVAVDGRRGRVYVGFHTARSGDADVSVWASADGGRRWSAPRRVNEAGPGGDRAQYLPQLAVAPGGRLDVVYYDRGADPGDTMNTVSLRSSFDGGRTFATGLRLSDRAFDSRVGLGSDRAMADLGDRLGLVATDGRALAVWTDTRAGTVADGRQDLARVVVDFRAPSDLRGELRLGGVAAGVIGLVLLVAPVTRRRRRRQPARAAG